MIKYLRLLTFLDRASIYKILALVVLCIAIGILDVLTVLASAELDFSNFDRPLFLYMAVIFSAATILRVIFCSLTPPCAQHYLRSRVCF